MGRQKIDITVPSAAPPAAVFALLADGASWPAWSPIDSFELERPGTRRGAFDPNIIQMPGRPAPPTDMIPTERIPDMLPGGRP